MLFLTLLVKEGVALYNLGKYSQAIQYYDKVLAVDPHHVNALYNKGVALWKLGNYSRAIQYYNKVLVIQPNYVNALINKGVALYDLGKYQDAIVSYDKVLALNANDVDAKNNIANAVGKLACMTGYTARLSLAWWNRCTEACSTLTRYSLIMGQSHISIANNCTFKTSKIRN